MFTQNLFDTQTDFSNFQQLLDSIQTRAANYTCTSTTWLRLIRRRPAAVRYIGALVRLDWMQRNAKHALAPAHDHHASSDSHASWGALKTRDGRTREGPANAVAKQTITKSNSRMHSSSVWIVEN